MDDNSSDDRRANGPDIAVEGTRVSADEFDAVFRELFPRVVGFCAERVRDRRLAEDIAQEAFEKTWGRWRQVQNPHAYVYVSALRMIGRYQKREQRRPRLVALVDWGKDGAVESTDTSIWDAVERLPKRQREAVLLHYRAGIPRPEVATLVGRPESTVRRWLLEAHTLLRPAVTGE